MHFYYYLTIFTHQAINVRLAKTIRKVLEPKKIKTIERENGSRFNSRSV